MNGIDHVYTDSVGNAGRVLIVTAQQAAQLNALAGELDELQMRGNDDQVVEVINLAELVDAGYLRGEDDYADVQLAGFFKKVKKFAKNATKAVGKALPVAAALLPVAGGVLGTVAAIGGAAASSAKSAPAPAAQPKSWVDDVGRILDSGANVIGAITGNRPATAPAGGGVPAAGAPWSLPTLPVSVGTSPAMIGLGLLAVGAVVYAATKKK